MSELLVSVSFHSNGGSRAVLSCVCEDVPSRLSLSKVQRQWAAVIVEPGRERCVRDWLRTSSSLALASSTHHSAGSHTGNVTVSTALPLPLFLWVNWLTDILHYKTIHTTGGCLVFTNRAEDSWILPSQCLCVRHQVLWAHSCGWNSSFVFLVVHLSASFSLTLSFNCVYDVLEIVFQMYFLPLPFCCEPYTMCFEECRQDSRAVQQCCSTNGRYSGLVLEIPEWMDLSEGSVALFFICLKPHLKTTNGLTMHLFQVYNTLKMCSRTIE